MPFLIQVARKPRTRECIVTVGDPHKNPYKQAEIHARTVRDFLIHLAIFLPSAGVLLLIALVSSPMLLWLLILVGIWGLGFLLHALALLHPFQHLSRLWDEDRLRRRYRKR
ncbi:hypothetical protein J2T60_002026 [Natronospira proteinivora]|uniref:2TM domain-containing protein n=1 Tax=Natronospira proteinivora TaxID=1807133 RepID=A0ABT1G9U4_9GAMM|nr:2TM domain-containing protein [Natronospira proteinivora]MCP1728026.1 hypothetical protein [Natronospira proteinivora]